MYHFLQYVTTLWKDTLMNKSRLTYSKDSQITQVPVIAMNHFTHFPG